MAACFTCLRARAAASHLSHNTSSRFQGWSGAPIPPARRSTVATVAAAAGTSSDSHSNAASLGRRQVLSSSAAAALAVAAGLGGTLAASGAAAPAPAAALELAPLGAVQRVGDKLEGLSPQQVADILTRNLREGQYFVTGDLSPEIFDDECVFRDPTNETRGLSRYIKALGLLFDPATSAVQLKDIRVTGPSTVEATWLLGGYLRFPWHPRVEAFEGRTVYHLNERGLIVLQDQTWSKSGFTALVESFTPTPGVKTDIKEKLSL